MKNILDTLKKRFQRGTLRFMRLLLPCGILIIVGKFFYGYFQNIITKIPVPDTVYTVPKSVWIAVLLGIIMLIIGVIPKVLYRRLDTFITRIPILGSIYSLFWNLTKMVEPDSKDFKGVYWVNLENEDVYCIGLMTNDIPQVIKMDNEEDRELYPILILSAFGMTSVVRWYTKEKLIENPMSVKDAMSLALSGGSMTTTLETHQNNYKQNN